MREREGREEGEGRDHAILHKVLGCLFFLAQRYNKTGLPIFSFMSLSVASRLQWMPQNTRSVPQSIRHQTLLF